MDVLLSGHSDYGRDPQWLGGHCLPKGSIARLKMSLLFLRAPVSAEASFLISAIPRSGGSGGQPGERERAILDHPDLALADNVWIALRTPVDRKKADQETREALRRAIAASANFGAACARAGLDGPHKWPDLCEARPGDPFGAVRAALEAAALREAIAGARAPGSALGGPFAPSRAAPRL